LAILAIAKAITVSPRSVVRKWSGSTSTSDGNIRTIDFEVGKNFLSGGQQRRSIQVLRENKKSGQQSCYEESGGQGNLKRLKNCRQQARNPAAKSSLDFRVCGSKM
jgi:hypothetical protein